MIEHRQWPAETEVNRSTVVRQSIAAKLAASAAFTAEGRHAPPPGEDETGGEGQ